MVPDDQLIQTALSGDSAAFGELVRRHQDRLYNTMLHVIGSAEDARDVVQDAFVKAFLKLETFQQTSAFYTWLYRIAFNTAMSRARRRRPMASIDLRRECGDEPLDRGSPAGERLEQEELARQIQAALATLSEEHRAVVSLRDIEGCDYEQIADILEIPVGTVRSRLHRARLQLREQLKEVFEPDHS